MGNGFLLGQTGGSVASGDSGWIYDLNAYDLYDEIYVAPASVAYANTIVDISGEGVFLGASAWATTVGSKANSVKVTIDGIVMFGWSSASNFEYYNDPVYFKQSLKIESVTGLMDTAIVPVSYSYLLKKTSPKPNLTNNVFDSTFGRTATYLSTTNKNIVSITGSGYLREFIALLKGGSGGNAVYATITIDGTTIVTDGGLIKTYTTNASKTAIIRGLYRFTTSLEIVGKVAVGSCLTECSYYLD